MILSKKKFSYNLDKTYLVFLLPAILLYIQQYIVFPSDEVLLYRTLLSGDPVLMSFDKIWPFYSQSSTRIEPLPGVWLNIILGFTSKPSQNSIFLLQAILFYIHVFWIYRCLEYSLSNKSIAIITTLGYAFSSPILYVWQRPLLAESYVLFFLSCLMFLLTKNIISRRSTLITSILLIAFLSILTKSSVFVIIFCIGSLLFIVSIMNNEFKRVYFYSSLGLVILSLIFLILIKTKGIANTIDINSDARLIKWFELYLANDPIGIVVLLLSPIVSILLLTKKKILIESLNDIFFISGGLYLLILMFIGKHSIYYLAPLYLLTIPKFGQFFELICSHKEKAKSILLWVCTIFTVLVLGFVNSISSGALTYWYPVLAVYPLLMTTLVLLHIGANNLLYQTNPIFLKILLGHLIGVFFYYLILPGLTIFVEQKINGKLFRDFSGDITQKIKFKNTTGVPKPLIGHTFANYECAASLMYAFFLSENLSFELNNENNFQLAPILSVESVDSCENAVNSFKNWNYKFFPLTLDNYGMKSTVNNEIDFIIGPTTRIENLSSFNCKIKEKNLFQYSALNSFFDKLSPYLRRPYINQGFYICEK